MKKAATFNDLVGFIFSEHCDLSVPENKAVIFAGPEDDSQIKKAEGMGLAPFESTEGGKAVLKALKENLLPEDKEEKVIRMAKVRYVSLAKGDLTIVREGLSLSESFRKEIIPVLLKCPHIKTINGVDFEQLIDFVETSINRVKEASSAYILRSIGLEKPGDTEKLVLLKHEEKAIRDAFYAVGGEEYKAQRTKLEVMNNDLFDSLLSVTALEKKHSLYGWMRAWPNVRLEIFIKRRAVRKEIGGIEKAIKKIKQLCLDHEKDLDSRHGHQNVFRECVCRLEKIAPLTQAKRELIRQEVAKFVPKEMDRIKASLNSKYSRRVKQGISF